MLEYSVILTYINQAQQHGETINITPLGPKRGFTFRAPAMKGQWAQTLSSVVRLQDRGALAKGPRSAGARL